MSLALLVLGMISTQAPQYPPTRRDDVAERHHGTTVPDPIAGWRTSIHRKRKRSSSSRTP